MPARSPIAELSYRPITVDATWSPLGRSPKGMEVPMAIWGPIAAIEDPCPSGRQYRHCRGAPAVATEKFQHPSKSPFVNCRNYEAHVG